MACTPVEPGARGVIAEQTALEDPKAPVRITAVELVQPKGIRLVEAFAVRYVDDEGIGTMSLDEPDRAWFTRERAVGAVIDGPGMWSLALVLERTGEERGSAAAVAYSFVDSAGQQQRARGTLGLEMDDPC